MPGAISTYRDLDVWKKSVDLVVDVYKLCKQLPDSERFGLISQMQRAATSIPANIAEGYGRSHRGDYLRHLSARGSLAELETHLIVAGKLEYVSRTAARKTWSLTQDIGRMLTKLMRALQKPSR